MKLPVRDNGLYHQSDRLIFQVGYRLTLLLTFLVMLVTPRLIAADAIVPSVVFEQSQMLSDFARDHPETPLVLSAEVNSADYFEVAVYENHSTHLVRIANLRVYRNANIMRETYDNNGEVCWVSDNVIKL